MPSIKRYAPRIMLWGKNPVFRAIKVTDNNHKTIRLFAGDQVSFKIIEKGNKSVKVVKEIVIGKTPKRHKKQAHNGDYIARQYDGKYLLLTRGEFEHLYQETHILIKDD